MTDETIQWRAQTYALLATLLASPPEQQLIEHLKKIEVTEPESPMGLEWTQLIAAAEQADVSAITDEYQVLFIGVTHGEIIPYGSYYQTGFLMEEPLALLRSDLAKLGLERHPDKSEPEDHVAAQCDVMRLILVADGTPIVSAQDFYKRHLAPWVVHFMQDLQQSKSANFYSAVARLGKTFLTLESRILTS